MHVHIHVYSHLLSPLSLCCRRIFFRELYTVCHSSYHLKPHPLQERLFWLTPTSSYTGTHVLVQCTCSSLNWCMCSECSGCEGSALGLLLRGRLWEDALSLVEQQTENKSPTYSALFHSMLATMAQVHV